jgi:hypothetical protein
VSYETKGLLAAIDEIMRLSGGDIRVAHKALRRLANVEGVILEPLDENEGKKAEGQS